MSCSICKKRGHKCNNRKFHSLKEETQNKLENKLTIHLNKKKKNKKSQNFLSSRKSDTKYNMIKTIVGRCYDNPNQPIFNEYDKLIKNKIFNLGKCLNCNKKITKGTKGDHLYAINEYHKITNQYGSNTKWNLIPICGRCNKGYKIFDTNNGKKDIGYQNLTKKEINKLPKKKKVLYNKIQEWKNYVKLRDAKLSYKFKEEHEIEMKKQLKQMYDSIDFNKFK